MAHSSLLQHWTFWLLVDAVNMIVLALLLRHAALAQSCLLPQLAGGVYLLTVCSKITGLVSRS